MATVNSVEEVDPNVPRVGMCFDSVEIAYEYYNSYARRTGFSVRRQRSTMDKAKTHIRSAEFVCSREGQYKKVNTPKKKRDDTRCGCQARLRVKCVGGIYVLDTFVENHDNHDMVPPDQAYLLRSQRHIDPNQKRMMSEMRDAGIGPSKINNYMCQIVGGAQNLGHTKRDSNNFLQQPRRKFLERGDVKSLTDWFKEMKRKNPQFLYEFWLDGDDIVQGVFFCDARSRREYGLFGDAICFDTTFNTNTYGMVCAPLVGINNHWQTTLFGCALLVGETTEAVTWLLTTFLQAMGGKHPETIFTDQSAAISNAISYVLPNTHHRLCLWHIYQNVAKHLGSTILAYRDFSSDLKHCIYFPECEHEFEDLWRKMIVQYDLEDNEWLDKLYTKRQQWALVYGRAYFCAGMTTTQRSESINKFLKDYFSTTTILREFAPAYMKAMDSRREAAKVEEFENFQKAPVLISTWKVERQASKFYTLKLFRMFQQELNRMVNFECILDNNDGDTYTYSVYHLDHRDSRARTVLYNNSEQCISCSCRKFEFLGYLCCHALRVFRKLEFSSLPSMYYLGRWSRHISKEIFTTSEGEIILDDVDPSVAADYSELTHMSQKIVARSVGSKERVSTVRNSFSELAQAIDAIRIDDEGPTNNDDEEEEMHMHDPKGKKIAGKDKRRKKGPLEKGQKKTSKKTGETSRPSTNMVSAPPQTFCPDPNALQQPVVIPNLNVLPYQVLWNTTMNYEVTPWQQPPNQYAPPPQDSWESNMNYGSQLQPPPSIGTQESNSVARNLFHDWTQYNEDF